MDKPKEKKVNRTNKYYIPWREDKPVDKGFNFYKITGFGDEADVAI